MTQPPTKTRILMIDDDIKLCRLIRNYLSPRGYTMAFAHDGAQGLEMMHTNDFQAVILDVMLPGMDGFDVLRQMRSFSTIPVLMLSALGDESDRIIGLEIGADDYLPKTFSTRELLARLRAVTRRASFATQKARAEVIDELVIGDLRLNVATREAWQGETLLPLTPLEFDLLHSFLRAPNRVLSRNQLLDAAAGNRDYEGFDRSMDVHISALRRKLGDDPKQPRYIRTVRAAGYLFLPQTEA